jgi:outer membrane lipoprotein SlyB
MRFILALTVLMLAGCGPNYSPDTYANNAVQQANKVMAGEIVGVRPVQISAQGAVGGVAGAAAGGVAGSTVGVGATSTFSAIGGSIIGGLAGVTAEHIVADTNGFEYVVRESSGDLVSVAQKDEKALRVGQKVLVIAGVQARIVPDYTVPFDAAPKPPAKAAAQTAAPDGASHAGPAANAEVPQIPATTAVPPQLPAAFGGTTGSASSVPPVIIPPAPAAPATTEAKP